jgi:hypothetical protein
VSEPLTGLAVAAVVVGVDPVGVVVVVLELEVEGVGVVAAVEAVL